MITQNSASTNIINNLMLYNITNSSIINAIKNTNMQLFLPNNLQSLAYSDISIKYNNNRYLMDIFTLANMLNLHWGLAKGNALVINSGNGYVGAVLSSIFNQVVNLDEDQEELNNAKQIYSQLNISNSLFVQSSLTNPTITEKFNLIIVDGAVTQINPNWLNLLKDNGMLIAVVSANNLGFITGFKNIEGSIVSTKYTHSPLPLIEKLNSNKFVF